jgi:hypothetical protein
MKTILGDQTYLSITVVAMLIAVAVWAVRQESHAAGDAIQIKFIGERLDAHEVRQNTLENQILERLINIDQRTARIEGKLNK